jgi:hypothetical protein
MDGNAKNNNKYKKEKDGRKQTKTTTKKSCEIELEKQSFLKKGKTNKRANLSQRQKKKQKKTDGADDTRASREKRNCNNKLRFYF